MEYNRENYVDVSYKLTEKDEAIVESVIDSIKELSSAPRGFAILVSATLLYCLDVGIGEECLVENIKHQFPLLIEGTTN